MRHRHTVRAFGLALFAAVAAAGLAVPAAAKSYIVELTGEPAAVAAARARAAGQPLSVEALEARRDELRLAQDAFLAELTRRNVRFGVERATIGDFAGGVHSVEHRYTLVYNGVALDLEPAAVAAVAAVPGVKAVHANPVRRPLLDRSVAYLRTPQVYGAVQELGPFDDLREGFEGQGTKISVIDTGIEWSHEMFGGDPTPPRHGLLPPTTGANNPKVIYYLPLMENVVDDFGHGTHAAADAAGYLGFAPGPDGLPNTADDVRLHGVAPQAKLMGYKVCSGVGSASATVGCLGTSIILAIEDSVSPRTLTGYPKPVADVINLSLGSSGGPDDSDSVAASNAALLGTIVVASAGNDGPGLATVGSPAAGRHVIAVGANNDPGVYPNSIQVLDALGQPDPRAPIMAAVWAPDSNAGKNITTPITARFVFAGFADTPDQVPVTVAGNICLVERGSSATVGDQGTGLFSVKAANCAAKGALATVVFNNVPGALEGVLAPSHRPVFTLSREDGLYLHQTVGYDAAGLSRQAIRINPESPGLFLAQMAGFSSRGPVKGLGQVKPDVTAPGVSVLAATSPLGVPVLSMQDATRYTSANGTSFSGPHVAGVAALLRQAHPSWTPDLVRAAMINYATNLRNGAGTPKASGPAADPITAQGGGLVDVAAAVGAKALLGVLGNGVEEPGLLGSWSFGSHPVVNNRVVHREQVTATLLDVSGEGGTYQLSVVDNRALAVPGISLSVEPSTVQLAPNGSANVMVAISIDGNQLRERPAEDLQWYVMARRSDGAAAPRMPFFLRPLPSQPALIVGEQTETYEGIVLAGDTGAELVGDVTYVDVPFTVGEATFRVDAVLDFIQVEAGLPDLDFALLDPAGEVIASSLRAGGPEEISTLVSGSGTYTYRVIGWANGPTPFTITSKQLLGGTPPQVLGIAGDYLNQQGQPVDFDGRFNVSWIPVGGEQGFEVERSTDGGASWSLVATEAAGDDNSVALTGQPDGTLSFRVRGLFPGKIGTFVSAPSAPVSVVVDRRTQVTITKSIKTAISNVAFSNGVFRLDLQMRNESSTTYLPLVTLSVVRIHSPSGTVHSIDADNGGDGRSKKTAASYDYSRLLGPDEELVPNELSGARELRFADPAAELFFFDVKVTAYRRTGPGGGGGGGPEGNTAPAAPESEPGLVESLLRFTVNPLTRTVGVSLIDILE